MVLSDRKRINISGKDEIYLFLKELSVPKYLVQNKYLTIADVNKPSVKPIAGLKEKSISHVQKWLNL